MEQQAQAKFSEKSRLVGFESAKLSPLGYTPLSAVRVRTDAVVRADPQFLSDLVKRWAASSTVSTELDGESVKIIAVNKSEVLVDSQYRPLQLSTEHLNHSVLQELAQPHQSRASLLYVGEWMPSEPAGSQSAVPVLALTGQWEKALTFSAPQVHLLGFDGEQQELTHVFATERGGQWVSARVLAEHCNNESPTTADSAQEDTQQWAQLASIAAALNNWHASASFDPRTGEPTFVTHSGWSRTTAQGRELFPRTDPAVITAVTAEFDNEQKILLGQARAWGKQRYSTFAGFVEAGESIENAVCRELYEECGAQVETLQYLGSQPWPFPRSLMLGFTAQISNPQSVVADGEEIETIRWFTRGELVSAHRSGEIQLPGASSISRMLIENFLGTPLS
ncbi:MAG: NAD(+) diphosphatase [Rothia sp. (in: high G+C Gram-positive bacteria)]|nr:NAD(+) diphosphatase [Rothia sp. (in: high G+C Gram-positive bacteria)]